MAEKTSGVQRLEDVWRLSTAQIRPEPVTFFKPQKNGNGVAARFNLRLQPKYVEEEKGGYLDEVEGGLFVDLVAQGDTNAQGFPTFKWQDAASIVRAKLGLVDVTNLLAAIRDFRVRGVEVATYLRGRDKAKNNVVSLFHQTDQSGTTGISYEFGPESSVLAISKSRDLRKSVSLTLGEEVALVAYLELALRAFLLLGVR